MLIRPKIDKLVFSIKKSDITENKLGDVINYLEMREDVQFNNSPCYITVNVTPTKLLRPNIRYLDNSFRHNLQMNTDLIIDLFEELRKFSVLTHNLNIKNLHIAKDRVMEELIQNYNKPLINNQTQFKGRVQAFEVNNGTIPTVHICNRSDSMNRGKWLDKIYNKGEQLRSFLDLDEITPLEPLSKEDIKTLGKGYSKYTGRIKLDKINLMRNEIELTGDGLLMLPHTGNRLKVVDIITMIKEETLYDNLDKVFKEVMKRALFPEKKEPIKNSLLDNFIVSDSMNRFDSLFLALDKFSDYKKYTNSVITEDDRLLNEIYYKFM